MLIEFNIHTSKYANYLRDKDEIDFLLKLAQADKQVLKEAIEGQHVFIKIGDYKERLEGTIISAKIGKK